MTRLTVSSPRLGASPRGLGSASSLVPAASPWREWYKTTEWRKLRQRVLRRENYTCRACGRVCGGAYPADDSPTCDHVAPHRGSRERFFDEANLQVLCKSPCHDRHKQTLEQASRHQIGVWD